MTARVNQIQLVTARTEENIEEVGNIMEIDLETTSNVQPIGFRLAMKSYTASYPRI